MEYFVRNLAYTELTNAHCDKLAMGSQLYFVDPGLVVTDAEGLALERNLAVVDFAEVIVWLLILATIELMVRLQDNGVTRGGQVTVIKSCKLALYTSLWGADKQLGKVVEPAIESDLEGIVGNR